MKAWDVTGYFTPKWKLIFEQLPESLEGCFVADAGMGDGILGWLIRHHYYPENFRIFGYETHKPLVQRQKPMKIYDVVIEQNLIDFDEEFDYILCIDVLEHNPKDQGLIILENLKRCGKNVIVTVPLEQPVHNEKRTKTAFKLRMEGDNIYTGHVSRWGREDFPGAHLIEWDRRGRNLSRSVRMFDTWRRRLFGVDWVPRGLMAVYSND